MDKPNADQADLDQPEPDDSIVFEEDKYINKLDLDHFAEGTRRLQILLAYAKTMLPGYGTFIKEGYEQPATVELPKPVKNAFDRSLISVLNQIERITNRDLEPIKLTPELTGEQS